MKSGLYICPGAPATCRAAVRAIWLARPGTRVSKLSAGLRRLRDGSDELSAAVAIALPLTCTKGEPDSPRTARVTGAPAPAAGAGPPLPAPSRGASVRSRRTGLPARSLSAVSIRPAYWVRIQSSLKRLGTRIVTVAPASPRSATSASGRGRIQVLNCWSGSSAARRSQPRCQRSARICGEVPGESRALYPAGGRPPGTYPQ